MTVAELSSKLTVDEEAEWHEHFVLKAEEQKAALESAKSKMPRR